jgi:FAD/FMN-containing dehydrogenase
MTPVQPDIDRYLGDASGYRGEASGVAIPEDIAELRRIVESCAGQRQPITIAGAGTGLTGARVPHGGLILSLERLHSIEVKPGRARCGAGALLSDLQAAAARAKQFFGPNPTENSASIGGIISTNAGGARSFKYRAVREHVLALEVTFLDGRSRWIERGEVVEFPFTPVRVPQTTKNSAGYFLHPGLEWIDLLAGSEGTLAVISAADLKLFPEPPAILSGVVFFRSDDDALEGVERWREVPELRLLEFMDEHALAFLRPGYPEIPPDARAALMIEQNLASEEDEEVERWAQRLEHENALADASWFGFRPADHERFRQFRHTLAATVTDTVRRRGFHKFSTDFAVPFQHHRALYAYYKQRCEEVLPAQYTIFGHAGDANNHINLLPTSAEEAQNGEDLMLEFAEYVVSLRGTVAAEHGIGKSKTHLLKLMYSAEEIAAMRDVKSRIDPDWLLGRGNIFGYPPD